MKSPASQLAAMSGVSVQASAAASLPTTQAGLFVRGDVKKGDAAHAFRLSIIRTAFLESLKGNPRNVAEIIEQSAGKSAICAGYQAGIAAVAGVNAMTRLVHAAECAHSASAKDVKKGDSVPMLQQFARAGKWDAKNNTPLRALGDTLADAATAAFASAWANGIALHKAGKEAAKEAKAATKAENEAAVQAALAAAAQAAAADKAPAEGDALTDVQADMLVAAEQAATLRAAAVATVADAIAHGMLSADDMQALVDAMAMAGVEFITPAPAVDTATPLLPALMAA